MQDQEDDPRYNERTSPSEEGGGDQKHRPSAVELLTRRADEIDRKPAETVQAGRQPALEGS